MNKTQRTDEERLVILHHIAALVNEDGLTLKEACKKEGIALSMYGKWKIKFIESGEFTTQVNATRGGARKRKDKPAKPREVVEETDDDDVCLVTSMGLRFGNSPLVEFGITGAEEVYIEHGGDRVTLSVLAWVTARDHLDELLIANGLIEVIE